MEKRYRVVLCVLVVTVVLWLKVQPFWAISETHQGRGSETVNGISSDDFVGNVNVTVYYESLCPDSKYFIIFQLQPVFALLGKFLSLDLVPYGKAKTVQTEDRTTFHCQHGEIECFGNRIHACVVHLLAGNTHMQLNYVACMIKDNLIPDDIAEQCGKKLNIDYTPILNCATGEKGAELLKKCGEKTHALQPPIKFVPTIELNGNQTAVPQSTILKNLLSAVCQLLDNKHPICNR